MIIPGISGLENRASQGDAAAALVIDGFTVAGAAEQRFNRKTHSGDFAANAILSCLQSAGIALKDIDKVARAASRSTRIQAARPHVLPWAPRHVGRWSHGRSQVHLYRDQ
jgi:predicted NodU family carbamoyl transferase